MVEFENLRIPEKCHFRPPAGSKTNVQEARFLCGRTIFKSAAQRPILHVTLQSYTWLVELVQRAILYRHKKYYLSGLTCPLTWVKLYKGMGRFFGHNFLLARSFGISRFVVLDIFIALRLIHTRPLEKSF